MLGGGTLKAKLKRGFNFIQEHRALPILLILIVGLTFGLSRLVLADTVTLKYRDENSKTQSLTLNKGSTIYLDPNFGYFKKDDNKRTKKLTLSNNLDLTNNYSTNANPYSVAKQSDPKEDLLNDKHAYGKNTTFSSIRTMQEMNPTICSNETTPTKEAVNTTVVHSTNTNLVPEARLKDTRDNKYYTVRKLADGNCWMTDNLAYAKAGTLKPEDSDVQDGNFTIANADIYIKEGEKRKWEDDKKFIYDRNSYIFKGWRKSRLSNGNVSLKAIYNLENPYGNLYTWHTATAGSGTYSMDEDGTNATSSLCPRGWRLPQKDGNNSYPNLLVTSYGLQERDKASSTKIRSSPLDFSLAGFYNYGVGQTYDTGYYGNYWSSTVSSSYYAYYLDFYSSGVDPQNWNLKAYGQSVRCLAR